MIITKVSVREQTNDVTAANVGALRDTPIKGLVRRVETLRVADRDHALARDHPAIADDTICRSAHRSTGWGGQVDPSMARTPLNVGRVEALDYHVRVNRPRKASARRIRSRRGSGQSGRRESRRGARVSSRQRQDRDEGGAKHKSTRGKTHVVSVTAGLQQRT